MWQNHSSAVDFVLESPERQIIGVEVKASATVQASDFKGLRKLQSLNAVAFASGVLLYDGTQAQSFGPGLWAVPLLAL